MSDTPVNTPAPAARWRVVVGTVLLLGLAVSVVVPHGRSRGFMRLSLQSLTSPDPGPNAAERVATAYTLYAPEGNVYLRFRDLPADGSQDLTALSYYYRSCYAIYPRRVYVLPTPGPVQVREDLPLDAPIPDAAWLREHDIRCVLTLGMRDGHFGVVDQEFPGL